MAELHILLTGGSGQVGSELARRARAGWHVSTPCHAELDITNSTRVADIIASRPWAAVINAAAFTDVDLAEREISAAWRVNALGPAILAEATARAKIPLIQLSTDYVFDGNKPTAYEEDDPVAPLGVYGASKEAGEQAVRTGNPRHVILRSAWIVSPYGRNFVKTILRLAGEKPVLRVVSDRHGCPTVAADIAAALVTITNRLADDRLAPLGTYHFVNAGEASWYDFAAAILSRVAARGRSVPLLEAIRSAEYPSPAKRPIHSRLSTARLQRDFGIVPRPWRDAVEEVVETLLAPQQGDVGPGRPILPVRGDDPPEHKPDGG